jgi:hypothetical protein
LDWLDMMFVVGVLLAGRRHARGRPSITAPRTIRVRARA